MPVKWIHAVYKIFDEAFHVIKIINFLFWWMNFGFLISTEISGNLFIMYIYLWDFAIKEQIIWIIIIIMSYKRIPWINLSAIPIKWTLWHLQLFLFVFLSHSFQNIGLVFNPPEAMDMNCISLLKFLCYPIRCDTQRLF